ncbi:hypothetical protein Tco_0409133 [Tanacetum coccineum]
MNSPETSRRLDKWAVELGAYGISCVPKNAIKGQGLANFLADNDRRRSCLRKSLSSDATPSLKEIPESSKTREEPANMGSMTEVDVWKYTPAEPTTIMDLEHGSS